MTQTSPPSPSDEERQHWAELARAAGWHVGELCHCEQPDLQALVGGDGWYAVNMCATCRRKVLRTGASRTEA